MPIRSHYMPFGVFIRWFSLLYYPLRSFLCVSGRNNAYSSCTGRHSCAIISQLNATCFRCPLSTQFAKQQVSVRIQCLRPSVLLTRKGSAQSRPCTLAPKLQLRLQRPHPGLTYCLRSHKHLATPSSCPSRSTDAVHDAGSATVARLAHPIKRRPR